MLVSGNSYIMYVLINCFCLVVDVVQYYFDWVVCPGKNANFIKWCIGVQMVTNCYYGICKQL